MGIIYRILVLTVLSCGMFVFADNIEISIPVNYKGEGNVISVNGDEDYLLGKSKLMHLVNEYLWYGVGIVSMGVFAWGGFLLISSEGDDSKAKTGYKLIAYALAGIVIALSATVITRLAVNLF